MLRCRCSARICGAQGQVGGERLGKNPTAVHEGTLRRHSDHDPEQDDPLAACLDPPASDPTLHAGECTVCCHATGREPSLWRKRSCKGRALPCPACVDCRNPFHDVGYVAHRESLFAQVFPAYPAGSADDVGDKVIPRDDGLAYDLIGQPPKL